VYCPAHEWALKPQPYSASRIDPKNFYSLFRFACAMPLFYLEPA
jgi:hypothetical protein